MKLSEQEKREGIANELADLHCRQKSIVECNLSMIDLFLEEDQKTFQAMAEEDAKNLRLIETMLSNFGLRTQARNFAQRTSELCFDVISDHTISSIEKIQCYALIKQSQVHASHLVHKSVQLAQPDVKEALAAAVAVQATMTRQSSQLLSLIEREGVSKIMGESPATGLFGRARDVASAAVGAILSYVVKPSDEMDVLSVLKLDHRKANMLFGEIEEAVDQQDAVDLFHQLKADLISHSESEELTIYKPFRKFPELRTRLDHSQIEHQDLRNKLEEMDDFEEDREMFLNRLQEIKILVQNHVEIEEREIFPLIRERATEEELVLLAGSFLLAKESIQEQLGGMDPDIPVVLSKPSVTHSTH